jgi:hypothetical protein
LLSLGHRGNAKAVSDAAARLAGGIPASRLTAAVLYAAGVLNELQDARNQDGLPHSDPKLLH